jgi:hypothetical protein
VYAGNTAELLLVGKEFIRDVGGFTHVFEALQVLFIAAFIHWCRTFDYIDQIPSAKFPYRRKETRQTVKTTKSKNMAIEITYNSITKCAS